MAAPGSVSTDIAKKVTFRGATDNDLYWIWRKTVDEKINPLGLTANNFVIGELDERKVAFGQVELR